MSSRMRDWIQPTVCNHLNEIIQDIQRDGRTSTLYGEDGTLKIHVTTGASVQVIEFISHAAPYPTWVSDSFTQIQAIFSKSSTESYQKQYGREFSWSSLGAVLGITDYYLTINPKNAPSYKIMLEIERFTVLGSEGSRAFGHPSQIESTAIVEKLMSKIQVEWHELSFGQPSPSDRTSPIQSQVGIEAYTSSVTEESTLETFSTQVPNNVLHQPTTGGHPNQDASKRSLLDMLGPKRTKTAKVRDHEPLVSSSCLNGLNMPVKLMTRGIDRPLMPSVSVQHSEIHQSPAANPFVAEPQSTKKDHLRDNMLIPQTTSEPTLSNDQKVTEVKRHNANGVLSTPGSPIETTISAQNDAVDSPRDTCINSTVPKKPYMPSQLFQDTENPWNGLTRIPRKYTKIPKDQQSILDSDRAWRSPAQGNRQPDEYLPRQVLDDLQAFHDRPRHDEKKRQIDDQSDSSSDDSESQEGCRTKSNHEMASQLHKSHRAQGQDSLRLFTLGNEDSTTVLTSFVSPSNRGNMHSGNGISAATEEGSEDEEYGKGAEKSHIGIWKGLPGDQVSSNPELDVSNASQGNEDDSTVEETVSWPSSPNRVELPKSPASLLPDSLRESTAVVQIDLMDSPQSQMLSKKISPMPVIDAASPLPDESQRNSQLNPHSDSEKYVESQFTKANMQIAQPPEPSCNRHNILFSSSPLEMEVSVPYALESQTLRSDNVSMTDELHVIEYMPFPSQRMRSSLEPESIEFGRTYTRSPPKKSSGVKMSGTSMLKQQIPGSSSDPVIPGTYRSEVSNAMTRSAELIYLAGNARLDGVASNADRVVSVTPGSPSPPSSHSDSPINDQKYSSGNENQDDIESQSLPSIYKPSQLSIPGTQISYCEPLRPPTPGLLADEIVFSTLAAPSKRRVYEIRDIVEPSPKRRRTLQAVIFDSVREKDSPIDPTEMAKANRRKFLQDLSLDDSSLVEILQKSQKGRGAQSYTVTMAETSLEKVSTTDTIRALGTDQQAAHQSYQKNDLAGRSLEKIVLQEVQEKLIDHVKQSTNNAGERTSNVNEIDNVNIREDETELLQYEMANGHGRISTDGSDFERCEGSYTISKPHSQSAPKLHTKTIFETFNTTYPSYGKSLRAFIRACVYLEWLHSMKRAPHPSLWDDFIRAFSAEYASHIDECRVSQQTPMSAHTYYNNHVLMPHFMKRIMNPTKLQEAFLLDPRETAKSCAIISRKFQKGSESTSTASSQLSVTDEIFTESQEMANLDPINTVSIFPQPSKPATMRCTSPHDEVGVVLPSNHTQDVVRASTNMLPAKRPFFETPSQLMTKDFHGVLELPKFSMSTPSDTFRVNTTNGNLSEGPGARDIETAHTTGLGQSPRHFPCSYSSQQTLESGRLPDISEGIRKRSGTTSQKQTHRQSPLPSSALKERQESPVLGSETSNPMRMGNNGTEIEPCPSLLTNLALCQDSVLRVPDLTASNPVERRTTSMSGLNELDLEISPIPHGTDGFHSLRMTKTQRSSELKISATFKDFSKAFIPRQKRRSSTVTRRPSAIVKHLGSAQTSRTAEISIGGSRPPVEPDTQVWRF